MLRAAIYARYSSENQHERSIDDQVRLCREHAARLSAEVVSVYADYAVSGANLRNRPEANRLLGDAKAGSFEMVISEALDRLSRDQEDVAAIHKRLKFAGVRLVTVSEGEVNELHVGLKGTMNALFLKDLAAKVKRGQRGRAAEGLVAGGRAYGYDVVREFDAKGEPVRGKRSINPAEAETILRIFRDYAVGISPRAIAASLNREGVPAPGGGLWTSSTINGSRSRGRGILYNDAYVGKLVWNRSSAMKDPDTGRRIARLNPAAERLTTDAPHLRIVPDDLWQAVQARKAALGANQPLHQHRRPKHLFSGLVTCGVCGGAMAIKSKDRLSCVRRFQSGACDNARTIATEDLERRVLEGLKGRLLAPDAVAAFLREYREERKRLAAAGRKRDGELRSKLAQIEKQSGNLVDAIADGIATQAMKERLLALDREKTEIEQELAEIAALLPPHVVELHPSAADAYRKRIADLQAALNGDKEAQQEAGAILRGLIIAIEVHPMEGRGETELRIRGALARIVELANRGPKEAARTVVLAEGMGFEPTIRVIPV